MEYKVWVQVEEIDEENDHFENLGGPLEAGVFKDQASAELFAECLADGIEWAKDTIAEFSIGCTKLDWLISCGVCEMTGNDCAFVNLSDLNEDHPQRAVEYLEKLVKGLDGVVYLYLHI